MGKYLTDSEARKLICKIGRQMYQKNLVNSTAGNISCKVSETTIWTTPTGVCKGNLTPDMLIHMDLQGNILNKSSYKPSSESKMHLAVYLENPQIQGVVHAHPIYASVCSVMGKDLDVPLLCEALLIGEKIPVSQYALPGSSELAKSVLPFCKKYKGALLANHGAITWDTSLLDAYYDMEILESYCQIFTLARMSGTPIPLNSECVDLMRKTYC